MLHHVSLIIKALPTHGALKRFLAGVRAEMSRQITVGHEHLSTEITPVQVFIVWLSPRSHGLGASTELFALSWPRLFNVSGLNSQVVVCHL